MLSGPEPFHLLEKSAKHLMHHSVRGALGPALARFSEQPECSQSYHELQECHWNLMQGISQLLQFKQSLMIGKEHPLNLVGRQIAHQAERLDRLKRQQQGFFREYIVEAMELDQSLQDFHDIVEEEL